MKQYHLNYIILSDGKVYRVFERLGKTVPFEAYNENRHLGIGESPMEAMENSCIPSYLIEDEPYEVIFNV